MGAGRKRRTGRQQDGIGQQWSWQTSSPIPVQFLVDLMVKGCFVKGFDGSCADVYGEPPLKHESYPEGNSEVLV